MAVCDSFSSLLRIYQGLAIIGKAALVQVGSADAIAGQGTLVLQADGGRRFVYNPRLLAAAHTLQRGSIYDRTGLPLATSSWDELEQHREEYKAIGIDIDQASSRAETRHSPLGPVTVHLLGDLRTRANWSASNSSLVERDSAVRLEGYDDRARVVEVADAAGKPFKTIRYDYSELIPLLRHRWEPGNPIVRRLRQRDRNVHTGNFGRSPDGSLAHFGGAPRATAPHPRRDRCDGSVQRRPTGIG